MRIGMIFHGHPAMQSLQYVAKSLMDAVAAEHELAFLPSDYAYWSDERTRKMSEEFVQSCDVLVGLPIQPVLDARQRIGSDVPFVGYLLGNMPRGGWALKEEVRYLTTNDVFIANCTAEMELAKKFFCNAQVRLVPFAIDEGVFYPLDEGERSAVREKLGFREQDRILLYAGRVTLEKNVHTLLRAFSAVQNLVPNACLVIAGPTLGFGFLEFGIFPMNLARTIREVISRLGLPEDRVRILGNADAGLLRELYNIADVKVNLSLHHDENFGLSQVEAMACGTPVVGTAWGGLKDTIVDGTSGYKVSTSPTLSGVKVNWWEAVNRMVGLLQDSGARARFRESCVRHAAEHYSQSRYEATLLEILAAASEGRTRPAEPLRTSEFAEEYWSTCNPGMKDSAPYRRGRRSLELYQELMVPFTGPSPDHVPADDELMPQHVLCLASPITGDGEGRFRSDDPVYPFEVEVPQPYLAAFAAILAAMREEPSITVERLGCLVSCVPSAAETLGWMLTTGLLLRTRPVHGWLRPEKIDRRMSQPLFRIQYFDRMKTDFIVF